MENKAEIIPTHPWSDGSEPEADGSPEEGGLSHWNAETSDHGERLDRVLALKAQGLTRSFVQQLIREGAARCNGVVCTKPSQKVRLGDVLGLEVRPTEQSQAFVPESIPLDVVFEDPHLLVINKPAGLVVHPAPGNWSGTLLNGLLAYEPLLSHIPRAGIVHRLDKDTSGLMVVAKTRTCMDYLVAMIASRTVHRHYLAIAGGTWKKGERDVRAEAWIGRDPRNRLKMAVVDPNVHPGKPSVTDILCLDTTDNATLVHCKLHTGRTHQIRVHMAWLGMPLLADTLYGGCAGMALKRQALHATRLMFDHPINGQSMLFEVAAASDFANELDLQGLRYNGFE